MIDVFFILFYVCLILGGDVRREGLYSLPRQLHSTLPRRGTEEARAGAVRIGDRNGGGLRLPDGGEASHVRLPCERHISAMHLFEGRCTLTG